MPNWKIHLEVGKRLNESLKYQGEDYEEFLLGNILPDINNSYLVKNISVKYKHGQTHFSNTKKPTYENFIEKYREKVVINPLFKGYYTHLMTDFIWNNDFYSKHNIQFGDDIQNHDELRQTKQRDFKIYNNKFFKNNIIVSNAEKLVQKISEIGEVSINKNDIIQVYEFLREQKTEEKVYSFYNEEQLDELLDKTVAQIIENLEFLEDKFNMIK